MTEEELQQRLAAIEAALDALNSPRGQRAFIAKEGDSATQWQERIFSSGALIDFAGGRKCEDDAAKSALVDLGDDFVVLAVLDPAGKCMRYVKVGGVSRYFVKVQKDGGSNGNQTTAASYTYTVKTLDGATTLGTSVALSRPREVGYVTYQAGSSGYGVGFYDGATFKLWDAGEIYGTGACT